MLLRPNLYFGIKVLGLGYEVKVMVLVRVNARLVSSNTRPASFAADMGFGSTSSTAA